MKVEKRESFGITHSSWQWRNENTFKKISLRPANIDWDLLTFECNIAEICQALEIIYTTEESHGKKNENDTVSQNNKIDHHNNL